MGQTTFANSRGIAHVGSGGQSPIFPDVCPIPYPNIGQASDTSDGPSTVKTDGNMPMTKDAKYRMSSGDEAGSIGGVVSNKIKGACEFMMYSMDIKFEGKNVCRLGDPLLHNEKNGVG